MFGWIKIPLSFFEGLGIMRSVRRQMLVTDFQVFFNKELDEGDVIRSDWTSTENDRVFH
jgi:hypothetical protein